MNLPINLNRSSNAQPGKSNKPARAQQFGDSKLAVEKDQEQAGVSINQIMRRGKSSSDVEKIDNPSEGKRTTRIMPPNARGNAKTNIIKTSSIKRSIFD